MSQKVLEGRTVVVTRAANQAAQLCRGLEGLGAQVIRLPLIQVVPASDGGASLEVAITQLNSYDWVVFTSANAVKILLDGLEGRAWPARTRVAAVGQASAKVLLDAGVPVSLVPAQATAGHLAQALNREFSGMTGRTVRVLAPLAELAGPDLVAGLSGPDVVVEEVEAYRTVLPEHPRELLVKAPKADAILLSSGSTVDRLVSVFGSVPAVPIICIGPKTADRLVARGGTPAVVANPHTEAGLIAATIQIIGQ